MTLLVNFCKSCFCLLLPLRFLAAALVRVATAGILVFARVIRFCGVLVVRLCAGLIWISTIRTPIIFRGIPTLVTAIATRRIIASGFVTALKIIVSTSALVILSEVRFSWTALDKFLLLLVWFDELGMDLIHPFAVVRRFDLDLLEVDRNRRGVDEHRLRIELSDARPVRRRFDYLIHLVTGRIVVVVVR